MSDQPALSAAAYEMLMHRLDHLERSSKERIEQLEKNMLSRMEGVLDGIEDAAKQIAVHAVKISQVEERRERATRDTHQRIHHAEQRIDQLESFAKAHSNGKAEP